MLGSISRRHSLLLLFQSFFPSELQEFKVHLMSRISLLFSHIPSFIKERSMRMVKYKGISRLKAAVCVLFTQPQVLGDGQAAGQLDVCRLQ